MWNPLQKLKPPDHTENFLLVTYDSCRFDAYRAAQTPALGAHAEARQGWAMATFTYPAHAAIFQGFLPHVFEEEEYYNRCVRQLWRRVHRNNGQAPRIKFPRVSKDIVDGFNRAGYFTCGTGAMGWFRDTPALVDHWQSFLYTGIDARKQVSFIKEQLSANKKRPFFAFINFGETHAPYRFDEPEISGSEGAAILREKNPTATRRPEWTFDEELWKKQVACVEFLDARMGDLLRYFDETNRDVTVVMCGDHGDCFGEDGLWGHGFYHPKVMEVPMAIFDYKANSAAGRAREPQAAGAAR